MTESKLFLLHLISKSPIQKQGAERQLVLVAPLLPLRRLRRRYRWIHEPSTIGMP